MCVGKFRRSRHNIKDLHSTICGGEWFHSYSEMFNTSLLSWTPAGDLRNQPTKKKKRTSLKISAGTLLCKLAFIVFCRWVTCTRSSALLSPQFVVVNAPACCRHYWKLCQHCIMTPERSHCSMKKVKPPQQNQRMCWGFFKEHSQTTKHNKSPLTFSTKSFTAIFQTMYFQAGVVEWLLCVMRVSWPCGHSVM